MKCSRISRRHLRYNLLSATVLKTGILRTMADDSKVSVKLLIDTKKNRVLFAEAGKDFVDFLFNLLALPVGTVIRLLTKENMVGCLGILYDSVENLGATYMQPNLNKDILLKPKAPTYGTKVPLLQSEYHISEPKLYTCSNGGCYTQHVSNNPNSNCPNCGTSMSTEPTWVGPKVLNEEASGSDAGYVKGVVTKVYVCGGNCRANYVSNDPNSNCPNCQNYNMSSEANWVGEKVSNAALGSEAGYVKGVVTYMVMDDLEVKPMSTISSITMLNKFNVKDLGALEERMVDITMAEGLKLLKASLQSKMVLTSVFLENSAAI